MSAVDAYLAAGGQAVEMLQKPEVAAAWDQPSALAEMSVAGLAAHVGYQILSVSATVDQPESEEKPIPLLEHYARAEWLGKPLDNEANSGIRARSESIASEGLQPLLERVGSAFAQQQVKLDALPGDQVVFLAATGWAMTLDDYLTTRLLELAVHMDDLAVSVGLDSQELPDDAFDPVLVLLARLSVRRHGQAALIRALARRERAPEAINAI